MSEAILIALVSGAVILGIAIHRLARLVERPNNPPPDKEFHDHDR
jgi:hypothetical protein